MGRNATLDYARLAAAFGIVLFHIGAPGGSVGYAALPFFLMLLILLAMSGAERMDFPDYAKSRALRLLRPWLIWSAVYGVLKLAEVALTGKPFAAEFSLFMLMTGPAIHLWFLPFALVSSLAIYPLGRFSSGPAVQGALLLLLTLGALIALGLRQGETLPIPLAQWSYALPAVFLGAGFGLARGRVMQVAWMSACAVAGGLCALALGWTEGLLQIALAAGALVACQILRMPDSGLSRQAANAALGVYLAHPLIASLLTRATPLTEHSLGLAIATALGALGLTLGLERLGRFPKTKP